MMNMETWPPPYTIRFSQRAKSVSLRVSHEKGLELVLPPGMSEADAMPFLQSKRRWIEKHSQWLTPTPKKALTFPEQIELPFLQQTWYTYFHQNQNVKRANFYQHADTLIFSGKFNQFEQCLPLLKKWLKSMAETHITIFLQQLSQQSGLYYENVTYRYQKTLWGSCSNRKNINLNIKLLLLPEKFVRYVLLHELCHTRHLNHSARFWRLLEKQMTGARLIDKELRHVEKNMPEWYAV